MTTAIASAIAATRAMVRMRRKWFAASATKSATSFTKSAASLTNSASASTNVRSSGGSVSVVAKLRTGDRNRSNRSETILFFMLHYNSPCEFLTCNVSLLVLHIGWFASRTYIQKNGRRAGSTTLRPTALVDDGVIRDFINFDQYRRGRAFEILDRHYAGAGSSASSPFQSTRS